MTGPAGGSWPGEPVALLAAAVAYADRVLDAVTPPLLSRPTPCRGWDLRMLLEHAEESVAALHEGMTEHEVALYPGPGRPGPGSAAALVAAFRQHAAALLRASAGAADEPPVAVGGHPVPVGCLCATGALEITVHAWDISQACGQRMPVPAGQAENLLAQARLLVPLPGRRPLFAAPVPVGPGSSPSDQLAAYLGRRPC